MANRRKSSFRSNQEEDNPFRIASNDDVFELRDRERRTKEAERKKQRKLKIWEKNPKPAYRLVVKSNIRPKKKQVQKRRQSRRSQETLPEFISKKRNMFLMQMSLNTKKEEIKKLEDKAQMKDEALDRSEKMLEQDAAKFDLFLKKNDKDAHDAFMAANREIKKKQEKIEELKKLTIEASKIESEISKLNDRLFECEKYKTFLLEVAEDARGTDNNESQAGGGDGEGNDDDENDATAKEDDDEILPFTEPRQLMGVFAQQEEANLFKIQISQRNEIELEQLRMRHRKSQEVVKVQNSEAQGNIKEIHAKIDAQLHSINSLRNGGSNEDDATADTLSPFIKKLESQIKSVFDACVKTMESDPILQLKEIEVKVDTLIDVIRGINTGERGQLEKRKEDERRANNREIKKAEIERANIERAEKSKARMQAETFKRTGKALMPRIRFRKYKKKTEIKDESNDQERLEHIQYFTDSAMA